MKLSYRVLLSLFLVFAFISPLHAIYLVDRPENPVLYEEMAGVNKKFPEICLIEKLDKNTGEVLSNGTGTFVARNIVLTARHVIEQRDDAGKVKFWATDRNLTYQKPDASTLNVICGQQKIKAIETYVFEDGRLDMALIVLEKALDHIRPRQVRAVTKHEDIESVTIAGYGKGRVICDWASYDNTQRHFMAEKVHEDMNNSFWKKKSLFRFRENIKGAFTIRGSLISRDWRVLELKMNSKYIRIGSGDSGGPVLDQNGVIIGVAASGNKKFEENEGEALVNGAAHSRVVNISIRKMIKDLGFALRLSLGHKICGYAGPASANRFAYHMLKKKYVSEAEAFYYTMRYYGENANKTMVEDIFKEPSFIAYRDAIQKRDAEIIDFLFGEEDKVFSGTHQCIFGEVKAWMDKVIEEHGIRVDDFENESTPLLGE